MREASQRAAVRSSDGALRLVAFAAVKPRPQPARAPGRSDRRRLRARRRGPASRVASAALALFASALAFAAPAGAQGTPSLDDLILGWGQGRYASPVYCEIDGELVRGVRRLVLKPEATPGRRPSLSVQFVDMRPENATRCVNSVGEAIPNVIGRVRLTRFDRPHPETGPRDFKHELRKDRGFAFEISSGALKLQDVARPPSEPRIVDFADGRARLDVVLPATLADRELADFKSKRKRLLTLESKGGERLTLALFDLEGE
jgi:hypothetical protein